MTRREAPRAAELGVLTSAKLVSNTALRWVGPFLPTLERAFGASTATLTTVMGVAELGGLTTTATGRWLDRGLQRTIFTAGLIGVVASSAIALGGSTVWFAVSFAVLVVGVANLTVAGHTWISGRVPYAQRGRAIGLLETSWALALLLGAPLIALAIDAGGWRAPYIGLCIAAALAVILVRATIPADAHVPAPTQHADNASPTIPASAWVTLVASALIAAAGLSVFIVSGTWLEDRHGVSTGGLGLVAMGFGALELLASSSSAFLADRLGKRRSVIVGLAVLLGGLALVAASRESLPIAIFGLTTFLAGFEFAFVTGLSLVTEAAPDARGRAIGVGNAIGTVARASAVLVSGRLYDAVGIGGSLGLSLATATIAGVLIGVGRRHER